MPSALRRGVVTLLVAAAAVAAVASAAVAADDGACTAGETCTTESVPADTTTTPPTTTEPPPTATTTTTTTTVPPPTAPTTTSEPADAGATSAWSVVGTTPKRPEAPKETEQQAATAARTAVAPPALGPQFVTPPLGGRYVFPVFGPASFTDTFGAPRADVSWHHGDDIFAPLGSPILAVADGTLFSVGWNDIGGNRLWLRDGRGNYFYYAHLAAFASGVADGVTVRRGQVIGFVGNTGDAAGTPYHLHFEIHPVSLLGFGYDGAVDPTKYLKSWQRASEPEGALAVAPAGKTAPPAGAVLLGASDISNADGLEPGALTRVLRSETRLAVPATIREHAPPAAEPAQPQEPAGSVALVRDFGGPLPPGIAGAGIWDQVATCESNRRWDVNTGNGFYGGLQFETGTWLAYGGAAFAPSAHLATREQQIIVAKRVLAAQGWLAWPACSARLGLR